MTNTAATPTAKKRYSYKLFLVAKPGNPDQLTSISVKWDDYVKMSQFLQKEPRLLASLAMQISREISDDGQRSWSEQVRSKLLAKLRGNYRPGLDEQAQEALAAANNSVWEQ